MRVNKRRKLKNKTPWLFLMLPLLIYGVWIAYPIIYSLILSFYNWDGFSAGTYVGLANFRELFLNSPLLIALKNNLVWTLVFLPVPTVLGFVLALKLYRDTKLNILLRSTFYLPMILSFAVMSIIWLWVYEPTHGVLTQTLQAFSLNSPTRSLVTNPQTAIIAIAVVGVWHWIGFPLVLYTAALKDIPRELIEAAEIDGVSWWQKIIYIIIPLVRNATMVAFSIGLVLSVKVFDLVFIMAGGYYKSDVLSTYVWKLAFNHFRFGMASTVSVIQFIIILIILVPYVWKNMNAGRIEF